MTGAQAHPTLRPRTALDDEAIAAVVAAAFGGREEVKLIEALRRDSDVVCEFVALEAGTIVGHIAFSHLDVRAGERSLNAAALAPLAVAPNLQRKGVGDALTRHALAQLGADGCGLVIVLGHPAYYPRFGFSPMLARLLDAPYAGPSFMALELKPGAVGTTRWTVTYPRAFGG